MTWVRFWRAENSNYVNCDYGGSHNYYDRGDDIYIMMKCLFVGVSRKMITFLKGLSVNHGFSRWFHGFWLVSMVFQGGFMFFHGFWLVSMVFKVVSWFLLGFYGFSRWFHGFSWFLVGFHGFQGFQLEFHCH